MMSGMQFDEPMIEAYVYETSQIIETLEQLLISSEKNIRFSKDEINEIFRFMHTIKGSSAMMMFQDISTLAHRLEDIFYLIRENEEVEYDFSKLIDWVLESVDFFKIEMIKIRNSEEPDGSSTELIEQLNNYLEDVKASNPSIAKSKQKKGQQKQETKEVEVQKYYIRPDKSEKSFKYFKTTLWFDEKSEMENIRSYTVIHNISELVEEVQYVPKDIIEDDSAADTIKKNGFLILGKTLKELDTIKEYLDKTVFLNRLDFSEITNGEYDAQVLELASDCVFEDIKVPETSKIYAEAKSVKDKSKQVHSVEKTDSSDHGTPLKQNMISVHVDKLDKLMDMVGELVITEAMVTQNPEVTCLDIDSFEKSSRQLHKITSELQDMVMAIRMVPLSTTFMKMHRIVRDMTRKLNKDVELVVYGEETEVDKNIIEKIADPLMHIIRNSIDHGIEDEESRKTSNKPEKGTVILEAKNAGSDVLIIIKDDGKGMDKLKLYEKGVQAGLVKREMQDMSDREIYQLILNPGFSTKEEVTEFSGRGVGMDVVAKNIESVGGTVIVDSELGVGTTILLKIPLTLAIIEGMNIKVGNSRFTIPIISIKESFRPSEKEIICDTQGQEMIMVRGVCFPIIRLYDFFGLEQSVTNISEGILIMVEEDEKSCCFFADELLGQQQVVVKALPEYIKKRKKIQGLGGCTLLGDGSISLILSVGEMGLSSVNDKI